MFSGFSSMLLSALKKQHWDFWLHKIPLVLQSSKNVLKEFHRELTNWNTKGTSCSCSSLPIACSHWNIWVLKPPRITWSFSRVFRLCQLCKADLAFLTAQTLAKILHNINMCSGEIQKIAHFSHRGRRGRREVEENAIWVLYWKTWAAFLQWSVGVCWSLLFQTQFMGSWRCEI